MLFGLTQNDVCVLILVEEVLTIICLARHRTGLPVNAHMAYGPPIPHSGAPGGCMLEEPQRVLMICALLSHVLHHTIHEGAGAFQWELLSSCSITLSGI